MVFQWLKEYRQVIVISPVSKLVNKLNQWRQRQVKHITSMRRKCMQYMKIMQRLVPHIKWQFLSPSKQIVRKETHQSRRYLNVL